MIPLRDDRTPGRFPAVTVLIITVNVAVFVYQVFFGRLSFDAYIETLGLIPTRVSALWRGVQLHQGVPPLLTVFTAMFMHGGFLHILGNMWFLWIFGGNVEGALGRSRFVLFYLITGVISFLAHVAVHPMSHVPLVGASGAIAGILGAYFVLFPTNRILTLIPIFFFVTTVRIPAAFFLGIWFLMQFLYSSMGGQVAWWAHIGGFVSGMILVRFFLPRRR
ncbi:MAG: rhomboid family intramembrane serine protease [Pseudomonadota bacterium]